MKKVVLWLPRETIRNSMPPSFINSDYEGTTCIIDCTEVFLHRPRKLMPRTQTYSNYKLHNTVKFLVAIAPNGYILYVSDVYGERASDKFITADCSIEDLLGPGDEIMADRGFSLSENLELQGVKLNMSTFTKGRPQFYEGDLAACSLRAARRGGPSDGRAHEQVGPAFAAASLVEPPSRTLSPRSAGCSAGEAETRPLMRAPSPVGCLSGVRLRSVSERRSQAMLQPDSMNAETTSLPGNRRNPLDVFTSMFR
ncbi:hypothetical protein MRX96_006857 [Rhipicephalus microplus]